MNYTETVKYLRKRRNPKNVAGMARFGITPAIPVLGVSLPELRKLARELGKDHVLANKLWDTKIHEARTLAALVEDPKQVTAKQMNAWVRDFQTWDLCDTVCGTLFDKTPYAYQKVMQWSARKEEFVKRAAFALIAWLAVHDKKADDNKFIKLFPIIKKCATDDRNYVRKAVNWALRQIGKRNGNLRLQAIKLVKEISKIDSKAARWIAADALRELNDPKIISMVAKRRL